MVYKDKSVFTGTWLDDQKVEGKMKWPTGAIYEGSFDNEIKHGNQGKYTWPSGDHYVGPWVNGNRTGKG